jgi:YjbE family integral membrane protein
LELFLTGLTIFGVNIILSGDNGVLIAMVAATLPKEQKTRAIAIGASLAVIFQVAATVAAIQLLHIRFLQLIGGMLILCISINLFRGESGSETAESHQHGFWKAICLIVLADLTMSTDNILAVAAIAKGDIRLLALGLGLSIVVVVYASAFLSSLIGRYPSILFAGAAILGNAAGQMIMADAFTVETLKPSGLLHRCVPIAAALGVMVVGYLIQRRRPAARNCHQRERLIGPIL